MEKLFISNALVFDFYCTELLTIIILYTLKRGYVLPPEETDAIRADNGVANE